jgi:hypothetical protein
LFASNLKHGKDENFSERKSCSTKLMTQIETIDVALLAVTNNYLI